MSPSTTNSTLFCIFFTLNDRTSYHEPPGRTFFSQRVFNHVLRGEVSLTFRPKPADPFPSQTRRRRRISKISEARDEQDVSTHARARDGVVVPPHADPRAPSRRLRRRPRRADKRRAEGTAAPTAVAVVRKVLPSVPGRRDRRDRSSPPQPPAPPPRGRDGPDGGAPAAAVARGARVWVGGLVWFVWRGRVGG